MKKFWSSLMHGGLWVAKWAATHPDDIAAIASVIQQAKK